MAERCTVAVFTSSRADAGPLAPLVAALDRDERFRLVLLVTGTHGSAEFGNTGTTFAVGPDSAVVRFADDLAAAEPVVLAAAGGRISSGVAAALDEHRPDALVVLGDRWELLYAVSPAVLARIPVAHLHGGEVTEGAIDERIRHAVTKLADLHLCAHADAAARIRQLGEPDDRIVVTGAPALDRFAEVRPIDPDSFARLTGVPLRRPFGLVTYHSVTTAERDQRADARAVFAACARELATVVVTHPGLDVGYSDVLAEATVAATHPHVALVRALGPDYPAVLAAADVVVGNSSSGIVEAASFGVPVVDVGDRQRGRLHGANVVHVAATESAVATAIRDAVGPGRRDPLPGLVNPYGDGRAVPRILDALLDLRGRGARPKRFVDRR